MQFKIRNVYEDLMGIHTLFQLGLKSLSAVYAQAVSGAIAFQKDIKNNYEAGQRLQFVRKLDRDLQDLSHNGSFYNRVSADFLLKGNIFENNCSTDLRINFSKPRLDDPSQKAKGHTTMTLDCSSWKNLFRDLQTFSAKYTKIYGEAYSDDQRDVASKTRKIAHLLIPYIKKAYENAEAENMILTRELN